MEIALSLLISLIGLLLYILVGPPALAATPPSPTNKVAEIGRIMFTVGLLAFLICFCNSPHTFGIVPK